MTVKAKVDRVALNQSQFGQARHTRNRKRVAKGIKISERPLDLAVVINKARQIVKGHCSSLWIDRCRSYKASFKALIDEAAVYALNQIVQHNAELISRIVYSVMQKKISSYIASPIIDAIIEVNREMERKSANISSMATMCRLYNRRHTLFQKIDPDWNRVHSIYKNLPSSGFFPSSSAIAADIDIHDKARMDNHRISLMVFFNPIEIKLHE